jgi:hypothetical protein
MAKQNRRLSGVAALFAAESTTLKQQEGELDTEFVKRIVNAYLDGLEKAEEFEENIAGFM